MATTEDEFDTHTYEVETFDLDGPLNRAAEIIATRKRDGSIVRVRVFSNGSVGGVTVLVVNDDEQPIDYEEQ